MNRQGRTTRGRVLAAAAVSAAVVLTVLPALAAHPAPTVEFSAAQAGDGFINASEAGAVTISGTYSPTDGSIDHVRSTISVVGGPGCPVVGTVGVDFLVPVNTAVDGVSGTWSETFDVSSLPEGPICARAVSHQAGIYSAIGASSTQPVLDLTPSTAPVITYPASGSTVGVVIKTSNSIGARAAHIEGSADPGDTVRVYEIDTPLGLLGTTTADANGFWVLEPVMTSNPTNPLQSQTRTYTIRAQTVDGAGNLSAFSPNVVFNLDANPPTARVTAPAGETIVFPGQPLIIEGVASDTNNQSFGGMLAIEINIHDPLDVEPTILPPSTGRGNLIVAQLGAVIHQENATCGACPALGTSQVSWSFDAGFLGPGTYTFQIKAFDKAGNTPDQPETLRVIVL